jgi:hypothetical protein
MVERSTTITEFKGSNPAPSGLGKNEKKIERNANLSIFKLFSFKALPL